MVIVHCSFPGACVLCTLCTGVIIYAKESSKIKKNVEMASGPPPGNFSVNGATNYSLSQLHPAMMANGLSQAQYMAQLAGQAGPNQVLVERSIGDVGQQEELNRLAEEEVEETVSGEVFSNYQFKEVIKGCRPHPGDIVEAGSLAALSMPPITYPLADSLPKELIIGGKLSSLQLEGTIYACQRHQLILPNGNRAGFFLGDAAGVGKGRQISGIILDNFARGRTRHVWFSISTDLIVDARRDLTDIGCYIKVIEGCQQLDRETKVLGLPSDFKEGVIFSTYATLVSSVNKGNSLNPNKQSRLQQLINWCGGENFDGCLIFDECHKAKNFVPGKESASTKVAMAVAHIQKLLPQARVLYCSATGVSDVKNMAFMERLGLWGDGAPFKGFDAFIETVQRKGLGVAEMMAMEMKSSGMYLSRGLSYKQAEFQTLEIELSKAQIKMYDTAAHVWFELKKALINAIDRTRSASPRIWSAFWGAHQRFFKQLCLGIKAPAIVREAKKALDEGCSVVIGLQTTGEASMEQEATRMSNTLTTWVSLCREILVRFIDNNFPTVIDGMTSDKGPVEDDWSVTAKTMLMEFAKKISLPNSPLDEVINELGGPGDVAEMTGRKARMVKLASDEHPIYQLRENNDSDIESLNVSERNAFMDGKKLVAIISDAASTGISLHADGRAANQRRRVHITMELPWSADKAVQQMGRSHRSNQTSGPLYKLMTTNLGGERRFAAAVAKRLQSLGALTKGDRRAATGADLTEFNFDTPYGRSALRTMYNCICHSEIVPGLSFQKVSKEEYQDFAPFNAFLMEGLNQMDIVEMDMIRACPKIKDKDNGDVGKFLNRILGLPYKKQQLLFHYFCECFEHQIDSAKREGRYNEGLVDIMASSVVMVGQPRAVFSEANQTNNPTRHVELEVDRGMSWDKAISRLENNPGKENGFCKSKRDTWGKPMFILATMKQGSNHIFKIARPNTGVSVYEEDKVDLMNKYSQISPEEAEEGWKIQYETAKEHCIHGPKCKQRGSCTVGSRCYRIHLLCGGIVTLMSTLETVLVRYGSRLQLTKAEMNLRVVRAQLNNGERVVGIRYPQMLITVVERELKDQKTVEGMLRNKIAQLSGEVEQEEKKEEKVNRRSITVQPVSVIVPKCLKKALTPPLTIKNFFKPAAKNSRATSQENEDSGEADSPHETFVNRGGEKDVGATAAEAGGSKATLVFRNANQDGATAPNGGKEPSEHRDGALPSSASRTVKRSNEESSSSQQPAPKKSRLLGKQANIMASFAKQKSIQAERKQLGMSCPICNKQFEVGTLNSIVNDHVDNCLIE